MITTSCPDCNGELEQGALLDFTYGGVIVERYAKTDVPTSTKMLVGIHEANYNDVRRVLAKRCTKCNRIFMYAQDIVLTPNLNSANNSRTLIVIGILALAGLIGFIVAFISH